MKLIPFDEILKEFSSFYITEYGLVQFKEIATKVHTSSTINKFLTETRRRKIKPLRDDILGVIHSILYFTFAKAEKISVGSAILLSKWHQEVAIPCEITDNGHLNDTFFDIIEKCNGFKIQNSNTDNFFIKFYNVIEKRFAEKAIGEIELQKKLNESKSMLSLIINSAFDKAYKHMLETLNLPLDDYDYLDEDERRKINSELFEISIIILAAIGVVSESDNQTKEAYFKKYSEFIGIKIDELSKLDENSSIFYTDEFELFMTISDRIKLYKHEIKRLIENQMYTAPYGIFYYFFLHPGNYHPDNEFTIFEETLVMNSIESFPIDEMTFAFAIKEICEQIKKLIKK